MSTTEVRREVTNANGIPPPDLDLPCPESPADVTANLLKLTELAPDPRARFVFKSLISKLHEFVSETKYVLLYYLIVPSPSICERNVFFWHALRVFPHGRDIHYAWSRIR